MSFILYSRVPFSITKPWKVHYTSTVPPLKRRHVPSLWGAKPGDEGQSWKTHAAEMADEE